MTNGTPLSAKGRPKLQPFARLQYDEARRRWVLQAPERVLELNETSKEIVVLCSGERSVGEIIDRLAAVYDAPRDAIAQDVEAVLQILGDKGVLAIEE